MSSSIAQLGIRLQLLVGPPATPKPAPLELVDALVSLTVTNNDRDLDDFRLEFRMSKDSSLEYTLLRGKLLDVPNRVIITMIFGAKPQVLIDGVITDLQVVPSNDPGRSTLYVTGDDISTRLNFDEKRETYPNQGDSTIVTQILSKAGFIPKVTNTKNTPRERERITSQQDTDLRFVQNLAKRNGFLFYVEPTDTPGVNIAYWGPENHQGQHQPALTMNMGPYTNVDTPINFHYNGLGPVEPEITIIDSTTKQPVKVPISNLQQGGLLSQNPGQPLRKSRSRESANLTFAEAQGQAAAGIAKSANPLTAQGQVEAARYGCALRARRLVDVRGAGQTYDGVYYVKQVIHEIRRFPTPGYTMRFTMAREGRGSSITRVTGQ